MMDCHEAKNYISSYLDEEISGGMADELFQHTEQCPDCRQLLLDLEYASKILQASGQTIMAAPDDFADSIMQQLGQKKESRLEPMVKIIKDGWKRLINRINRHN